MRTIAQSPPSSIDAFNLRRFTVAEFHALGEAGVLGDEDRVELLDGVLVMMTPMKPPHVYVVEELYQQLLDQLSAGTHVRMQHPITLAKSEPQPDLALVQGTRADYRKRHPGPKDILLLVEVSDTTLRTDRFKAGLYAAAGVPNYWIVNLTEREVEVYSLPRRGRGAKPAEYTVHETLTARETLTISIGRKSLSIPIRSILP